VDLVVKALEKAAAELANGRAGWVIRRDAAEELGKVAEFALRTLLARRQEPDVDVKSAVDRALSRVSAALAGVPPKGGYSLEELAGACAKPSERVVTRDGDAFTVEVAMKDGRRQRIRVERADRGRGAIVFLSTECGAVAPDALAWALRANADLSLSALALCKEGGDDRLVLRASYVASEATPLEIKAAVKEMAFYGDWIEQKLMGSDDQR
jgi:hypothetical protein